MAELMLVNPRKRGRRKTRTAAQKRATRKLVAANRRRRSPARRRANPTPARRRVRRSPVRSVVARKRRYRRNPAGRGLVNGTLIPAAVAATGALSLDVLWGFVPLPETLKTGPLRHVVKGAGAIGLGWLAGQVVKKQTAAQLATGALTVVTYNAFRELAAKFMPNIPLGYYSAGYPAGSMGEYVGPGMGAYIGGDMTSPYLSKGNLSAPFSGPSAADMAYQKGVATGAALENEQNMGRYY